MKKIILLIAFVAFLFFITTKIVQGYNSAIAIREEKERTEALQSRINNMSVPELIDYLAPENASKIKKIAFCESNYNPNAIHYNDGGSGKHSVGVLQFQESTFLSYEKRMNEDLNYYSSYDQIKVANYMINKGQIHQWSCSRLTGLS